MCTGRERMLMHIFGDSWWTLKSCYIKLFYVINVKWKREMILKIKPLRKKESK